MKREKSENSGLNQTFVEFQKFPNVDGAADLITTLEKHNIQFAVDDRGQRFSLVSNPFDNFIIIKIKESDIEKANNLLEMQTEKDFENHGEDHYLYTFSDKDIVDIIANQDEWSNLELIIAHKIAKDRKIELSAEKIRTAKRQKIEQEIHEKHRERSKIRNTANWFIIIAGLSVINSIVLTFNLNFRMLFGLGITQLIDGVIYGITGETGIYNVIVSIIISLIFLLFWYYAKKEKAWAFIIGMIVYGFDMLLFLLVKDWLSIGLHFFVLIALSSGLMSLSENKKKKESLQS